MSALKTCHHPTEGEAYHKVQAIADTYAVTKQGVLAKVKAQALPHSRTNGVDVVEFFGGAASSPYRWTFVSDSDLREWIRRGVTFGNGIPHGTRRGSREPGSQDIAARTITLSCGWTVTDIPRPELKEKARAANITRLVRCIHGHESGKALHSISAVAIALGAGLQDVFARATTRVQVGLKWYVDDATARGLGAHGRLACGYELPPG